ncbi:hypothetical protein AMK24_04635 [Streptomyces sp. CB02366]|nr:hypothetical protein [Streptomyces sp. CB02366]OKJ41145.1 hypothetical protein AMK24_04635 [Streptomyces sp. CB02366]
MRCCVDGGAHGFPVEEGAAAYCAERGVTWLWRGEPVTAADVSGGAVVALDALSVGADGPCSVVCRSGSVTDLADVHAVCRLPECVCPCHVAATALRDVG